jgi:hypothetical protein
LHGLSDFERHEVLSDHQRTIIGLARFGDEIVDRCRRHLLACEEDEMCEGCELRLGARKDRAGLAGGRVMRHDALYVGLCRQLRPDDRHLVDQEVSTGAVFHDILAVACVARDHDRATRVFDSVPEGRFDGRAVVDLEGDDLEAACVIDDAIAIELLHRDRRTCRR